MDFFVLSESSVSHDKKVKARNGRSGSGRKEIMCCNQGRGDTI